MSHAHAFYATFLAWYRVCTRFRKEKSHVLLRMDAVRHPAHAFSDPKPHAFRSEARFHGPPGLYHEPKEKTLQCVLKRAGPSLYNEHFQGLTIQARRAESYNAHSLSEEGNEGTTYKSYGGPYLSLEASLPLASPCSPRGPADGGSGRFAAADQGLPRRSRDLNPARLVSSRTTLTGRWQVVESQGRSGAPRS